MSLRSTIVHLVFCCFAVLLMVAAVTAQPAAQQDLDERARALQKEVPLIDGHNDFPWALRQNVERDLSRLDIRVAQPSIHTDIPRLREGGVGAQFWSVYVPASFVGADAVTATLEEVDTVHRMMRRYPEAFELALTADDVERIFRGGKIASMMGMEGGHSIDSSLATLRMFYRLGVRYMTLTHGSNVPWADSSTDEPVLGGLSRFGEEVVREMNWLGMLIDLSHVSPDTMRDALRVTEAPVIFSHSSARALTDVPRNVPDDVLRLVAENGGVVMVTFVPQFISPDVAGHGRAAEAEELRLEAAYPGNANAVETGMQTWLEVNPTPRATLSQVADHIDHVRNIAGLENIGIGSDFDGISSVPLGLEDVSTYPSLTAELLRRGYTDEHVMGILGVNVLRVMREAEAVAERLQRTRPPSPTLIEHLDGR